MIYLSPGPLWIGTDKRNVGLPLPQCQEALLKGLKNKQTCISCRLFRLETFDEKNWQTK